MSTVSHLFTNISNQTDCTGPGVALPSCTGKRRIHLIPCRMEAGKGLSVPAWPCWQQMAAGVFLASISNHVPLSGTCWSRVPALPGAERGWWPRWALLQDFPRDPGLTLDPLSLHPFPVWGDHASQVRWLLRQRDEDLQMAVLEEEI